MFKLEQSITEWRQQMLAAGIKTPVLLEELENHLREGIERLEKAGQGPQPAFEMAVRTIGQCGELKREFNRATEPFVTRLVKLTGIGCGAISLMLTLWCIQFLFYQPNLMPRILGLMAVATSILCWKYGFKFLPTIRHDLIRAMIGLAGCASGVIWIQLFILRFVPGLTTHPPGGEVAEGRLLATVLWACTAMAILSSISYGLEKAAQREIATATA